MTAPTRERAIKTPRSYFSLRATMAPAQRSGAGLIIVLLSLLTVAAVFLDAVFLDIGMGR